MINVSEGGRHSISGRMRIYRIFRNAGQILVLVVLLLMFAPFLPPVGILDATAVLALVFMVAMLSVLSWGVLRPAFDRASSAFMARLVLMNDRDNGSEDRAYCDD